MSRVKPLPSAALRWRCATDFLDFESTADIEPSRGVVGQDLAREALRFGLDCRAPDQNVYVRGQRGTGRMSLVQELLEEMSPVCHRQLDRCYVHNFLQPDRPRLVSLPRGEGRALRRRLRRVAEFVARELPDAMNSKPLQASRSAMQEEARAEIQQITEPFEAELKAQGLALVQLKSGQGTQSAIFPLFEGKPVAPEQYEQLVAEGKVEETSRKAYREKRDVFARRLPELTTAIGRIYRRSARRVETFNEQQIHRLLGELIEPIRQDFNNEALAVFLQELVDDVVEQHLHNPSESYVPADRYGINVLLEHIGDDSPVVVDSSPNLPNLLGSIETQWSRGRAVSDYRGIRGGALLRADGGFLILDAHDVLAEPAAWKILMRTLRTGLLEIVPAEMSAPFAPTSLKPEPIPISVRVVLLGSRSLYYRLDAADHDFSEQFKILADFHDVIDRSKAAIWHYAGVLARMVRRENLRHFTPGAVAALAEHGARVAGQAGKLTARFGRMADIAREASWIAEQAGDERVTDAHVRETVARTKRRASLPSVQFQSHLHERRIRIETRGRQVGQINGLAVISAGPLRYGFPARITATIGAGSEGVIDIEGQSALSGSIHTKGFQILGGLLRHLLKTDHPLTFSASLAFEQSYGGIDGDSASGAEICCLLSALTELPLRQDLAITGAIDQHGALQVIGGVNEKIEGFFDICDHFGLTGTQGVVIPAANAGDLMLRHDVVQACADGRFSVYAVDRIEQALALFTGRRVGRWNSKQKRYTDGSVLAIAREKAHQFWRETRRGPVPQPVEGKETK